MQEKTQHVVCKIILSTTYSIPNGLFSVCDFIVRFPNCVISWQTETTLFKELKILGIDPGIATIGFAIIENSKLQNFGVIKTPAKLGLPERLRIIAEDMAELINQYRPDIAVVEQLFFVQNVTNGIAVAHGRGVILAALAKEGITIKEISPKDVKIAVCGYGNAEKQQVQRAIQLIFKLDHIPKPDDAADAIAIAYSATTNR
jgi:crossover junction endodeoxyribonuclease RuvC